MNWAEWILAILGCIPLTAFGFVLWSELTWRHVRKRDDVKFYKKCEEEVRWWRIAGCPSAEDLRKFYRMKKMAEFEQASKKEND